MKESRTDLSSVRCGLIGYSPLQIGKAGIIAVERHPLTTPFDGERCEPRIAHPGTSRAGLNAQPLENLPVPLAWFDDLGMRLVQEVLAECKGFIDATRHAEDTRVGGDPYDCAQCERRQSEPRISF